MKDQGGSCLIKGTFLVNTYLLRTHSSEYIHTRAVVMH